MLLLCICFTCYLYNVGAKRFYTEGNAYGTQGSVGDEGLKCKFVNRNGSVVLTDSTVAKRAWRTAFVTTNDALFVDAETATECHWNVVKGEGKTFKLMPATPNAVYNQENYPGAMLGLDTFEDDYRTVLASVLMDAEEPGTGIYHTDWMMVTPEGYQNYLTGVATYKTSLVLKALLEEAKEKGLDVTAEEEIYNNTSSTLSEIEAACGRITYALQAEQFNSASKDNPLDVTAFFVTNPSYDNTDNVGWKGTVPGMNTNDKLQNAEFFNTNFDYYQNLTNLPEGYYQISVQGYYRAGLPAEALTHKNEGETNYMNAELYGTTDGKTNASKLQSIFAGAPTEKQNANGEINLGSWWVPDGMAAAATYFSNGYYNDNHVTVYVNNGKLRIGMRKTTTIRRDWVMFDNWTLTYYGSDNPEE